MCFSAEASFVAAGALVPAGVYCVRAAVRRLPAYRLFALIPLGFAAQQAAEGFVWLGIERGNSDWTLAASGVFLFFALAWWPFWFPVSAAVAESRPERRRLFVAWAVFASGWFFLGYLPALFDPYARLAAERAHHSIRYPYADDVVFGGATRWPLTVLYCLCTAGPLLALARRDLVPVVVLGLGSVAVAWVVYSHAYTSVWCFFAALLSAYCVYFFATAEADPGEPPLESATPAT
jgi:hypothetical protein